MFAIYLVKKNLRFIWVMKAYSSIFCLYFYQESVNLLKRKKCVGKPLWLASPAFGGATQISRKRKFI
jgi:hypothetical protein